MEPRTDLWLQNLIDERDGAALYEGLALHEKDQGKAASFRELAEAERRHADVWIRKLEKAGVAIPPDRPSSRIRALIWLGRRLGSDAVVPMILDAEAGDADKYDAQGGDASAIADEERAHHVVLAGMGKGKPTGARDLIAVRERWHGASVHAGSIRAAIFGMNDGLVSNLSLILGVAGAGMPAGTVMVTGIAGLLAGAFSTKQYTSLPARSPGPAGGAGAAQMRPERRPSWRSSSSRRGSPPRRPRGWPRGCSRTLRPRPTRWCARSWGSTPTTSARRWARRSRPS
jgi:hypothetical protein